MASRKSLDHAASRTDADQPTSRLLVIGVAGILAVVAALAGLAQLPAPLVLPSASALLVASGLGLAAIAYLRGLRIASPGRVGSFEVAGALLFLGFAAALLTDSDQALAIFDQVSTHGLATLAR